MCVMSNTRTRHFKPARRSRRISNLGRTLVWLFRGFQKDRNIFSAIANKIQNVAIEFCVTILITTFELCLQPFRRCTKASVPTLQKWRPRFPHAAYSIYRLSAIFQSVVDLTRSTAEGCDTSACTPALDESDPSPSSGCYETNNFHVRGTPTVGTRNIPGKLLSLRCIRPCRRHRRGRRHCRPRRFD